MKIRLMCYVGRTSWTWDYPDSVAGERDAETRIRKLLTLGFRTKSRAGVHSIIPHHRISRITKRKINS